MVRYVKVLIAADADESIEAGDFMNLGNDLDSAMLSSNFLTLTMDLAFRCNYVATIQGLIANKIMVDTLYALPEFVPYWLKCIVFFFITLPVNLFTIVDDLLGLFFVWQRFNVHRDFFDLGILGGKGARNIFQLYIGIFMLWRYMLQYIRVPSWLAVWVMKLKFW